jgi:Tol biopolymer transport system component
VIRRLLIGLVVVGLGAGVFILWPRTATEPVLADADCRPSAPAMALNLYGDLRQDDIAVVTRGGEVNRLTRDNASFDSSFSPDGSEIVFTSGREGAQEECCGYLDQEIYLMEADGSNQRRLIPDGDHFDYAPVWSSDGREIAFARKGVGLMSVPATGGEPRIVHPTKVDIRHIEWSPGGERLAFSQGKNIYLVESDGGKADWFASAEADGLAWSPDGTTIAYTAAFGIHTSTLEEPNPRLFAEDAHTPAWSPDGEFLAYYAGVDEDQRIVAQPADGGDEIPFDLGTNDLYSFETDLEWLDCPGK